MDRMDVEMGHKVANDNQSNNEHSSSNNMSVKSIIGMMKESIIFAKPGGMTMKDHASPIPVNRRSMAGPVVSSMINRSRTLSIHSNDGEDNDLSTTRARSNSNNNNQVITRRSSLGQQRLGWNASDTVSSTHNMMHAPSGNMDSNSPYQSRRHRSLSLQMVDDNESKKMNMIVIQQQQKQSQRSLQSTLDGDDGLSQEKVYGSRHAISMKSSSSYSLYVSVIGVILLIAFVTITLHISVDDHRSITTAAGGKAMNSNMDKRILADTDDADGDLMTSQITSSLSEQEDDVEKNEKVEPVYNVSSTPCESFKVAVNCLFEVPRCVWAGEKAGCVSSNPRYTPSPSNKLSISKKPSNAPSKRPTKNPTSKTTSKPTKKDNTHTSNVPTIAATTSSPSHFTSSPTTLTSTGNNTISPTSTPTVDGTTTDGGDYDDGNIDPTQAYNIDIVYTNPSTPLSVVTAFKAAKARWESIITNDIQSTYIYKANTACYGVSSTILSYDKIVDDLLIFAVIESIDGKGGVLGSAGPCIATNIGGKYARVGLMRFDLADLDALDRQGTLQSVILHEMGHVIGLGTLWSSLKLRDETGEFYTGGGGEEGQKDIAGAGRPLIELDGGPGTAGGHWDKATYQNELMTGWLSTKPKLSLLTVKSLKDLGFVINPRHADSDYKIPSSQGSGGRLLENETDEIKFDFGNDVIQHQTIVDDENYIPYDENGIPIIPPN